MSAHVCDDKTFDYLGKAIDAYMADINTHGVSVDSLPSDVDPDIKHSVETGSMVYARTNSHHLAKILQFENVRSVNYRYDYAPESESLYKPRPIMEDVDALLVLKLIENVRYQSCERPDYEQSLACRILDILQKIAIRKLPGYDETPWELSY